MTAPLAIAHRGDPRRHTENTLASFDSAVRAGADMVELDLRCTRDGAIVVLHDQTLNRLWGDHRAVADLDLAEVQSLGPNRSTDQRIPTLAELLAAVPLPLMVDFTGEEVVAGALEAVRHANAIDRSLFVSGNVPALRALRALAHHFISWAKSRH